MAKDDLANFEPRYAPQPERARPFSRAIRAVDNGSGKNREADLQIDLNLANGTRRRNFTAS